MSDLGDVEICRLQEEVHAVRAENERLQAALKQILDMPLPKNMDDIMNDGPNMVEIAAKALAAERRTG